MTKVTGKEKAAKRFQLKAAFGREPMTRRDPAPISRLGVGERNLPATGLQVEGLTYRVGFAIQQGMQMAYYELKRTGLQYMFNLRGTNHEVMLTSERYTTRQGALNGIAAVRVCAPHEQCYRRLVTQGGAPYFVLTAANGEPIGVSEAYSSPYARDIGIQRVKAVAPSAPASDKT